MSDIDPNAHGKLPPAGKAGSGTGSFGDMATAPLSGQPTGNETLAWLAGNRMPDRRKSLQPPAGASDLHADTVLREARPSNPIEAAQRRATILADLRQESPRDPRVKAVFETDPIVAEDPANGNLVTQGMLRARLDLFDAVLTMLGRPMLARGMRSRAMVTLKSAYVSLTDDAQVEWALSEVRLEEVKAYLTARPQAELNEMGKRVAGIYAQDDLWSAARTFSVSAHIGIAQGPGSATLADLLEMRELE